MNKWTKILLVFSLSLNLAVLGALGYSIANQYKTKEPFSQSPSLKQDLPSQVLQSRNDFRRRLWEKRAQIQKEREILMELLMEQPPNKYRIEKKLNDINILHSQIQRSIIDRILWETKYMDPQQRRIYLSKIKRRLCRKKGMGMWKIDNMPHRMGRGFRGCYR